MPWAIACDFDATATIADIGDDVARRFAGTAVYDRAEDEYRAGAIDFRGLLERLFTPITASREEIAAFARERAVLRAGFAELVGLARTTGRPFVLCSAGLDVYIEPVLAQLPAPLRATITMNTNRAVCGPAGMALHFPGAGTGCGRCGSCKGHMVTELQRAGYRVAFCGDGTSDRCGADVADLVFARASLLAYCRERGLAHQPFDTFHDVIAAFPDGW